MTSDWSSRQYRDEQDLKQMMGLVMRGRRQTDDWHYAHIGDLVWRFFMVECRVDPRENFRLWYDNDDLIGYAVAGGDDVSIDWQVLPEYEWRGIEDEAMAWAATRLEELARRDPESWGGNVAARATKNDAKRIAFLQQHRFARGEYSEVNMLRPLDAPVPQLAHPTGCIVRHIQDAEDNAKRADAYRAIWHPYTVANVSDDQFARFMELPGYERELEIVGIAADDRVAAQVMCWIDPVNRIGDMGPVGTRPEYRREGYARAALVEGLRRMQARGMKRACISTGIRNEAARNLYESIGFSIVNETLEFVRTTQR